MADACPVHASDFGKHQHDVVLSVLGSVCGNFASFCFTNSANPAVEINLWVASVRIGLLFEYWDGLGCLS